MVESIATTHPLLEAAYEKLGFAEGALLDATEKPCEGTAQHWLDKGEWLTLGHRVEAEKVFFVGHNPVLVFADAGTADPNKMRRLFNRIWCMCRPQCAFIASPGELAVYDLSRPPVRSCGDLDDEGRLIERVKTVAEVQEKLQRFRRSQVESGRVFGEERFGADELTRADQALVRDLDVVRDRLTGEGGLAPRFAHALIARSIFIRYLEDRGILLSRDFRRVAARHKTWQRVLEAQPSQPDIDPEMNGLLYPRVLSHKGLTYALFRKLSEDFNGDMFPVDSEEERAVQPEHLHMLQSFLRGDVDPRQRSLFFFAYRFDVIPIELISSIYEAFYNVRTDAQGEHGTYYTPSALVEFVLSLALTPQRLSRRPRIIDPACGSGIFLVEAFRRIVRFRVQHNPGGRRLRLGELRAIMRDQIAGIDIDGEAVRVAAFSLYLALLHYLDPPDIWRNKQLPYLKYSPEEDKDRDQDKTFNILVEGNAFDIDDAIPDDALRAKFSSACADIVIGNPPWGQPQMKDAEGRRVANVGLRWCEDRGKPIGDNERSQAFIHRTLDLLTAGGAAGLLVSHGVLLKEHENSRRFRETWLRSAQLSTIVNFAHVRTVFFSGPGRKKRAISPFIAACFAKTDAPDAGMRFEYWSAKRTPMVEKLQAVVLSRPDLRLLQQSDRTRDHAFWKTYWWGNHRDDALVQSLGLWPSLCGNGDGTGEWIAYSQAGFKAKGGKPIPADWLGDYDEFPVRRFDRYTPLQQVKLQDVPANVVRRRARELYEGLRLLVKEAPDQRRGKCGEIAARLVDEPFAFRHSIQGFRFQDAATWQPKVILGIMWSSLARYYLFLRSSSWGLWHDKISLEEFRCFPVRLPGEKRLRDRIVDAVDGLNSLDRSDPFESWVRDEKRILQQLDDAVFRLYELTEAESDLVLDMCQTGLDLFYKHVSSDAVKPVDLPLSGVYFGTADALPSARSKQKGLQGYLRVFLEAWNPEFGQDGEFRWHVVRAAQDAPLLGVVFSTQHKGSPLPPPAETNEQAWEQLLARLADAAVTPWHSSRIYIDGLVRSVSDTECIIVKRDERRMWTRSMAREDAEATLLQACLLQQSRQGARG